MTTVDCVFHGRLFHMVGEAFPKEFPRPFGDGRTIALSAWRGGVEPRLWLVPDGWESEGLEQVFGIETDGRLEPCGEDQPGAKAVTLHGLRMMKVA